MRRPQGAEPGLPAGRKQEAVRVPLPGAEVDIPQPENTGEAEPGVMGGLFPQSLGGPGKIVISYPFTKPMSTKQAPTVCTGAKGVRERGSPVACTKCRLWVDCPGPGPASFLHEHPHP